MIPWREGGLKDKMWAWPHTEGILQQKKKPPYSRKSKGNRIPNILPSTAMSITENSISLCAYNTEKYRHFNSLDKERKTSHQLPWEWALVKLSFLSKANRCLRILRCRSCQKRRQPFGEARHSQTISQPASQTVFINRAQHLNETFYLSKYVMFSQHRWTEVSGVSVSSLLPRLTCEHSTYWRGSKKRLV